jgi:predicted dehydrogenase
MVNVVLVGAGKLGSRHLQGLSQTKINNTNLFVIDPSSASLDLAKERFKEMPINNNIASLTYLKDIESLAIRNVDVVIIATTSEHRKSVVINLCEIFKIKNMILEKFLFQDEESYNEISKVLDQKDINTWVNCPRRQWSFYKDLKSHLADVKIQQVDVTGTKWSIATSAIHFIDLISFIVGAVDYKIVSLDFGNTHVPAYSAVTGARESKYIEFFGAMHGRFIDSTFFNFTCTQDEMPFSVTLLTSRGSINIFEELGKCFISSYDDVSGISIQEINVSMPFQSELTNLVADDLILNGTCSLTPYNESVKLHLPVLKAYLTYLNDMTGKINEVCPIT